jgi:competence protein ComEC
VVASLWAIRAPLPDVLVSSDGAALAVRGADGRLTVHRTARDAFAAKEWLAADGDARLPNDKDLAQGFRCDTSGCIARLADGRLVSQVIAPDAFEEDCRRAAVVVTSRELPGACQALVIDRKVSRASGAVALRRLGKGFEITAAVPPGRTGPGRALRRRRTKPCPHQRARRRVTRRRERRIWRRGIEGRG